MGDKKLYIVAKVFDRPGCLAYRCKTANEARCLPGTLEAIRAELLPAGTGRAGERLTQVERELSLLSEAVALAEAAEAGGPIA